MTLSMTVDTTGVSPYSRFDWAEASTIWAREAAPLAQSMLKAHAPFKTGALRASITYRAEPGAGQMIILFYATVFYAKYVLDGTAPHTITARNARALRWLGPGGMGVHFAKSVNHPGTSANPFPARALAPLGNELALLFSRAVQEQMQL